ncbi:MAG: GAF domain-containing protein [Chloroflexota bacterium]|nr:GAF domain-containing protein [Chloroflexota bacterium]
MPPSNNQELERRARELYALTEVAKTLAAPLDLPDLLGAVMGKLARVLEPAEMGVIMLWDNSSGVFRPAASFGYNLLDIREVGLRAGESVTGKVFDQGVPRLLNSAEVAEAMSDMRPPNRLAMIRALGTENLPHSALAVPLRVGERKFGVLVLEILHQPAHFSDADLMFVQTLADLIALQVDRSRLENETVLARDARQVDRLRSEALATLSHELRTPLATIKGYSTALLLEETTWSDGKRSEFLQLIDAECDNLTAMINDILDSSLFDVGRLVIERQPVRLQHLAREVADEMQTHTEIHRIAVDFAPDLPILDADPRRIKQVIRNILDNAIKYSPGGGLVIIRGQVRPTDVVVSISDQGVGISPEDLIPLFEKYFRVKSPTGYHVAGTGLGLPVARAIVEAHGGRIWAESKVGQGTTLYFSLPRAGLSAEAERQ